jgi:hypothetical protein
MLAIGEAVWDILDPIEYEQTRSAASVTASGNDQTSHRQIITLFVVSGNGRLGSFGPVRAICA